MEDVVSRVVHGLGDTVDVFYSRNVLIKRYPLLDDVGFPFDRIGF